MNLVLPYLFVFILGVCLFCIIQRRYPYNDPLDIIITFWLGIGACALATFYTIAICGHYDALAIKAVTILLTILSYIICRLRFKPTVCLPSGNTKPWTGWLIFLMLALLFWELMNIHSSHNPYGDWDAWSFWNYIPRYIILGGSHWPDLYIYGQEAKHPWALPAWNVFGWTWGSGQELNIFTHLSSQIFALVALASVFFGILQLRERLVPALLASLWLLSIPIFISHSVSQYADVIMAGLIAINMLLLLRLKANPSRADTVTMGLMLGLMAFVKDDGILGAIIMFFLLIWAVKLNKKSYLSVFASFGIVFLATILIKYWLSLAPQSEHLFYLPQLADGIRWYLTGMDFWYLLTDKLYGGIVIIPVMLILIKLFHGWNKNAGIIAKFLISYTIFFLSFVLIRNNLVNFLAGSSYRFIYQLLPLAMILLFTCAV